jgi:hypothetical protein
MSRDSSVPSPENEHFYGIEEAESGPSALEAANVCSYCLTMATPCRSPPWLRRVRQSTLCRQTPEVGAVCVNSARTDLCGGRPAIGVPTANIDCDKRRTFRQSAFPWCLRNNRAGTERGCSPELVCTPSRRMVCVEVSRCFVRMQRCRSLGNGNAQRANAAAEDR